MSVFLLIVIGLPILDAVWWYWADARLRRLRRPGAWRIALAAFVGGNLAIYVWIILARRLGLPGTVPVPLLSVCYIWHLVVLPLTMLGLTAALAAWALVRGFMRVARGRAASRTRAAHLETPDRAARTSGVLEGPSHRTHPRVTCPVTALDPPGAVPDPAPTPLDPPAAAPHPRDAAPAPGPSRRQVLLAAATAVPVLATGMGQLCGMSQLRSFRTRKIEVGVPALPTALDGLTIAHLSDLHVGRFTKGRVLDDVIARTNALRPDLVVFTGDLVDHSLSDLPAGLSVLRQAASGRPWFMCEGNHDLFEGRAAFEHRVRRAGAPLLLNESDTLELRGHRVQVLGLRWAGRGASLDDDMDRVLRLTRSDVFTILLAHHPHAFDRAAAAGVPLTLAGHTHGGQFMLTGDVGAGSLLFKYWSGAYRGGESTLVVSNGVGNWFPLRINAPAEIVHLVLRAECATARSAAVVSRGLRPAGRASEAALRASRDRRAAGRSRR